MSLECTNTGILHTHDRAEEVLVCYGLIASTRLHPSFRPAPAAPVASDLRPASPAQVDYVKGLRGNPAAARRMTRRACSDYITALKAGTAPIYDDVDETYPVSVPEPTAEELEKPSPPEHLIEYDMLDLLAEGYYAVREDDSSPWRFYFVSRPKSGKYKDTIKIQMQHGSYGDGKWTPVYVAYNSSKTVYCQDRRQKEHVMMVIAGQSQAMRDYSAAIKRCSRCNATLTDDRSLYYGIGPECEKMNPGLIEDVAIAKGAFYEDRA